LKRIVGIVAVVVVAVGTVRVGLAVVSRGSGCRPGTDPAPKGAPPFPQGPTQRQGIWVIDADGANETAVAAERHAGEAPLAAIAWSPDGSQVAMVDTASYALTVSPIDGGGRRTLVPSAGQPAWSPDGRQIAFVGNGIEAINIDGTGRRPVAVSPTSRGRLFDPAWSPDGTRIAYVTDLDTIEVIDVDGTNRRTITSQRSFRLSHPAWSPDGTRLVFAAHGGYYGSWLGIIRTDGTGLRKIAGHCSAADPTWSPDDSTIAYDDQYGLNTIDADGHHRRRVSNSWYGHAPAWSPDGQRLLFLRY